VDLTTADIAHIPAENMRVSRDEFGAVWSEAEQLHDDRVSQHIQDWYGAGVVVTCRWLACATVRSPSGAPRPARSPVTKRTGMATPELIEAEWLAAEVLDARRPTPDWLATRPGWSAGIVATLAWAWRHGTAPPVDMGRSGVG
jgi:hypothetical protein